MNIDFYKLKKFVVKDYGVFKNIIVFFYENAMDFLYNISYIIKEYVIKEFVNG